MKVNSILITCRNTVYYTFTLHSLEVFMDVDIGRHLEILMKKASVITILHGTVM